MIFYELLHTTAYSRAGEGLPSVEFPVLCRVRDITGMQDETKRFGLIEAEVVMAQSGFHRFDLLEM